MPVVDLFPTDQIVGVFRGFREGGLEFHADLVLPYRNDFQSIPMHGQFLLVQLETPDEAVLGRIASLSSEGKLTSDSGDEFNIRAVREGRTVPEDLREQYLRYRVNMRVLGVLRADEGEVMFVPSHRRLPHVGSPIAFPAPEVLREIAGHNVKGAPLGYFALGEYIYTGGTSENLEREPWMQIKSPEVLVKFPIENLVSRRTFVFARAGFGKSNLTKLLFSKLYEQTPMVAKRSGRQVPVGTVIFDPDGEYFWPDDKGRPGLCDVPELREKLVIFTPRRAPSAYYGSFVAGPIKLDLRRLRPADVISIALDVDRQDQQNVRKLRQLSQERWAELIGLADEQGYQLDVKRVASILGLQSGSQDIEAIAALSNVVGIVNQLHDRHSLMIEMLEQALEEGKLCVVDVSQMRGNQSLVLSGLILRRLFARNQEQFTQAVPKTIPTIAVIEEAQSVLDERKAAAEPYVTWVKEGRKYDLGAVLVTQQPGSIPNEILSQGDNWFIFHLLSATDLMKLKQANAHFSDDLLSSLLNEPIPGHGIVWSSASKKPYPNSVRVLPFELLYNVQDPLYVQASVPTFAAELKRRVAKDLKQGASVGLAGLAVGSGNGRSELVPDSFTPEPDVVTDGAVRSGGQEDAGLPDALDVQRRVARHAIENDAETMGYLRGNGAYWGRVGQVIEQALPAMFQGQSVGFKLVQPTLDALFGTKEGGGWHTFKSPTGKVLIKTGTPVGDGDDAKG